MDEDIKSIHAALQGAQAKLAKLEGVAFTPKPFPPGPFCSFCGKSQEECQLLVQGPSVYICNECIRACQDILDARTS